MISARPPESRSSVAKSWNTRTGSSELSTVTALVSRMLSCARPPRPARPRARRRRIGAVMLADAEDVEADLVGQLDLLDQLAQIGGRPVSDPSRRHRVALRSCRHLSPSLILSMHYPCVRQPTAVSPAWPVARPRAPTGQPARAAAPARSAELHQLALLVEASGRMAHGHLGVDHPGAHGGEHLAQLCLRPDGAEGSGGGADHRHRLAPDRIARKRA